MGGRGNRQAKALNIIKSQKEKPSSSPSAGGLRVWETDFSAGFTMRRFFGTRRLFLSGKNKISILNPYSGWSSLICTTLHRVAVLATLCVLTTLLLQQQAARRELEGSRELPGGRIFCIIATYGYRHNHAAVHVKRTWAKQCDHFLFVSDDAHEELEPAAFQKLPDKWQRLRAELEYVYKYHFEEGDWFLYANDDK